LLARTAERSAGGEGFSGEGTIFFEGVGLGGEEEFLQRRAAPGSSWTMRAINLSASAERLKAERLER